jgi:hypothetical protein
MQAKSAMYGPMGTWRQNAILPGRIFGAFAKDASPHHSSFGEVGAPAAAAPL